MNILERYFVKTLRLDEAVIRIARTSWFHYRSSIIFLLIILLIDVFLFYPLRQFGGKGIFVFVGFLLLAFLWLLRTVLVRSLNIFIITNQRFIDIDQRKMLERHVTECPLAQILNVRYVKKGLVAMLFDVGTVVIESSNTAGHLEIADIRHPAQVQELIMNTIRQYNKERAKGQVKEIEL